MASAMMFRRSSHISIQVSPERIESATDYYKRTFDLVEGKREAGSVELQGPNFTIWVDEGNPDAIQEFVVSDGSKAREALCDAGAEILGDTSCGFHVRDPYGLRYHVYIETES